MLSPLSFRLGRRLVLSLVIAVLLATLATPLHASPAPGAAFTGPLSGLIDWVQDLLQRLGSAPVAGGDGPEAPTAVFLPEGCGIDPDGKPTPCPNPQVSPPRFEPLSPAPDRGSGPRTR